MRRVAALCLLFACSDKTETETDPVEETDTTVEDTDTQADIAWSDMDRDQRRAYMSSTFMPEIKAIMVDFDPAYNSVSCTTCHGTSMVADNYEMPNGLAPFSVMELPLPGASPLADLMYDEVVPKAAELLGYEPYDFATREGFGCYGCHDQP